MSEDETTGAASGRPFPDSLCHRCAAPPRHIQTARSTFIFCPVFKRYPPQPVKECDRFIPYPADVPTA